MHLNTYIYHAAEWYILFLIFSTFQVDAYRFLVKLIDMDRNKLSTKQRISYDVLKNVLTTYTDGYTWIE